MIIIIVRTINAQQSVSSGLVPPAACPAVPSFLWSVRFVALQQFWKPFLRIPLTAAPCIIVTNLGVTTQHHHHVKMLNTVSDIHFFFSQKACAHRTTRYAAEYRAYNRNVQIDWLIAIACRQQENKRCQYNCSYFIYLQSKFYTNSDVPSLTMTHRKESKHEEF